MSELKVGGEVDAYCTKCRMMLAHTVLAVWAGEIKRVRCNTCMGEHAYRRGEPGSAASKPSRPRAAAAEKPARPAESAAVSSSYEELISGKDRSSARPFNVKQKYAIGDLLQHPTFGLGVVAAVRGPDKVDVAFPHSLKTLAHNKGSGPVALAKPPPPRRPDVEVAEEGDPAAETSDEPSGAAEA